MHIACSCTCGTAPELPKTSSCFPTLAIVFAQIPSYEDPGDEADARGGLIPRFKILGTRLMLEVVSFPGSHVWRFWGQSETVISTMLGIYHISLNRRHPRIVATQSEALEWNKRRPQTAAAGSKRNTCLHVRMISDDSHHASARTVCCMSRFHGWQQDWEGAHASDSV